MDARLTIDVALHPALVTAAADGSRAVVVLVDMLCGSSTVALALDDGRGVVRLVDDTARAAGVARPSALAAVHEEGDRLAAPDLVAVARAVHEAVAPDLVLVGSLLNARPLASMLARALDGVDAVTFACAGDGAAVAVEDAYCCGVLIHLLLEEADVAMSLTDAAGICVSVAGTHDDHHGAISRGATALWLAADGDAGVADIAACAQADMVGAVGRVSAVSVDPEEGGATSIDVVPWVLGA